jgi:hypothetical protein
VTHHQMTSDDVGYVLGAAEQALSLTTA